MLEILSSFWPWYIGGPLLGLTVPALILLTGHQLGISLCFKPPLAIMFGKKIPFFNYLWQTDVWRMVFVFGIAVGGFLALHVFAASAPPDINPATVSALKELGITDFSSILPADLFGIHMASNPAVVAFLVIGGFLVGFGARYANGCTSGHAIMGISYFQIASVIAAASFFAGGLFMTHVIYPYIMESVLK